MLLLSTSLFYSCYKLLLQCPQFASDQLLRAMFVTRELAPFQEMLPKAEDRSSRVNLLIDYLIDKKTRDGQSVFIIFLNALRISISESDDLYGKLISLCEDIEIEHFCNIYVSNSMKTPFYASINGSISIIQRELLIELTKHFIGFRSLKEQPLRKEIINLLPEEITGGISHNGQTTSEIEVGLQLIQACAYSPNGFEKLAYALYKREGITPYWSKLDAMMRDMSKTIVTYTRLQQLQDILLSTQCWSVQALKHAYRASNPSGRLHLLARSKSPLQLMQSMIDDLASLPVQNDKTVPLFVFVLKLLDYIYAQKEMKIQKDLYGWIDDRFVERQFDDHLIVLHQKKADEQQFYTSYHLLIELVPEGKELFWMRGCLLDSNNVVHPDVHVDYEEKVISIEEVPIILSAVLDRCADYLLEKVEKLVVEFLLPNKLLYHPVDDYRVNTGMGQAKLGIQYQVVVRSLERTLNRKGIMYARWKRKWEILEELLDSGIEEEKMSELVWIGQEDHGETFASLYPTLLDPSIVVQGLTYVPLDNDFDGLMRATLAAGIPVALWPRVKTDTPETVAHFISTVLSSNKFPSLPDFILEQRRKAGRSKDSHHQGHHWTLLWDNPNRYQEEAPQLSMPLVRKGV